LILATAAAALEDDRAPMETRAPLAATLRHVACPIPVFPPVTIKLFRSGKEEKMW